MLLACFTFVCPSPVPNSVTRSGFKSGLVSGALSSVLLGFAATEAEEARLPGHIKACTARLRYVDDQIWVSAADCRGFVEKQLRETYPAGVEFSTTSDGTNRAEWLPNAQARRSRNFNGSTKPGVPCGGHLVPPFVNNTKSLDWVLPRGMVKCRQCPSAAECLPKDVLRHAL